MEDIEKLGEALKDSLKTGKFEKIFLEDLFYLWKLEGISPEVVLREIRALEGKDETLMTIDDNSPIPIWFIGSNSTEADTLYKTSPSATKDEIQFTKKGSPLKGMWHKHYYIHRHDFLNKNIQNEENKHKSLKNSSDLMKIILRIAEKSVTGEWIIFKKEGGINTYICLAKHDDEDNKIYERIQKVGNSSPLSKP